MNIALGKQGVGAAFGLAECLVYYYFPGKRKKTEFYLAKRKEERLDITKIYLLRSL